MYNLYFNQEQARQNLYPPMNKIPNEFLSHVTNIENMVGDENCGFQVIVVSFYHGEIYWLQYHSDLHKLLSYLLGHKFHKTRLRQF